MTTDIAVRDHHNMPAKIEYARLLADSGLLPQAYRKQPANILYAVEYGELLGLPAMAAITGIHVIDGRPTASSGLMSALVRKAGHRLRVTGNDREAVCQITRADDPGFVYTATWTIDRAKAAGLLGKTNWRQYPQAMLKARAVSEAARDACQEVLLGITYTADELGADDDGGEYVDDGFPTLPGGQLDGTQMSEQSKDDAGLMTRDQRIEHADLRNMNKVDPAAVEHLTEPDPGDPWATPAPAVTPPAPKTWTDKLAKLIKPVPLGSDEDRVTLLTWITGRPVDVADPQFTRTEVKLIADMVEDHLRLAEGDTELAATRLWERFHKANAVQPESPPAEPRTRRPGKSDLAEAFELHNLLSSLPIGPPETRADDELTLLSWLAGEPFDDSPGHVAAVLPQLQKYVSDAGGDVEEAVKQLWLMHDAAQGGTNG